ncbi:MAG TPA: metalloregulator ArsR/SmtB family transcription factor [Longimicrobiales bacterium]|nr:metalloregulator ArsR/SmtB family transcription factor [Longimicrobiales bacterium]
MLLALSDPTRLRIVELLRRRELDAGEIAAHFETSRPGVSRHLRVLRDHGLVRTRSVAQRRIYRLNPGPLRELDRWLEPYRQFWSERLDALEAHVRTTRAGGDA